MTTGSSRHGCVFATCKLLNRTEKLLFVFRFFVLFLFVCFSPFLTTGPVTLFPVGLSLHSIQWDIVDAEIKALTSVEDLDLSKDFV